MSSAGVTGQAAEEGAPVPLPGRGASVAVVVAHPDDESLWAGGLLLSHPEWRVFVAALCRRSDPDRAPKFYLALKRLGAGGAMGDLDDGPQQRPLSEGEVASQVLSLLPAGVYDLVVTHSPRGEYTRHRRHEEAARAVLRLWREGTLHAKALWTFAYEDGGGAYLPRAEERASFTLPLPGPVWAEKRRIITDIYGFQEESWEARTVPRREAFWRAGASEDPHPAMGACKAGGNRGGVRGFISNRASPIKGLGSPPSLARRLQGWGGVPGGLGPRGGEGMALPAMEAKRYDPQASQFPKARELHREIGKETESWAREVAANP